MTEGLSSRDLDAASSDEIADDNWFSPPNKLFPYSEVYNTLDAQENEFRLLELQPGDPEDPIKCVVINNVALSTREKASRNYEALSYSAGDPKDCQSIFVNGHAFNAFKSLWTALRYFRHPNKVRILWIDQICINQTDLGERGQQVLKMRDVYRYASQTLVWLGEASLVPNSDLALQVVREFLSINSHYLSESMSKFGSETTNVWEMRQNWWQSIVQHESEGTLSREPNFMKAVKWLYDKLTSPTNVGIGPAVQNILQRPWWKRCWCVQEAVVSSELLIYCGSECTTWEELSLTLIVLGRINYPALARESGSDSWFEVRTITKEVYVTELSRNHHRIPSSEINLTGVLITTLGRAASDLRDKVYSQLGLVDEELLDKYGIEPNYSRYNTVADVFIASTKAILLVHRTLEPLSHVQLDKKTLDLPSWVPDWSGKVSERPVSWASSPVGLGGHGAGKAGGQSDPVVAFANNDRHMITWAYIVGSVELVDVVYTAGGLESDQQVAASWLLALQSLAEKLSWSKVLASLYVTLRLSHQYPAGLLQFEQSESIRELAQRLGERLFENAHAQTYHAYNRRLFALHDGKIGLCDRSARANDLICIPIGSEVPFVIRPIEEAEHYRFVGECYIHGIMQGEFVAEQEQMDIDPVEICLV